MSELKEFYSGKVVFLTGGTGFLGKALIEKLLRSCPDIKQIYLLIRGHKELDFNQRCLQMFQSQAFDRVRETGVLSKVVPINGDLNSPGLGITELEKTLIFDNVNIVFHSAASTNMSSHLTKTFPINTVGTKYLLDLCQEIKNLESFVYVSTAYSNAGSKTSSKIIEEKVYSSPIDIEEIFIFYKDEGYLNTIHNSLVPEQYGSGYSLSKVLAESLLEKYSGTLPLSIVRPSIILAACIEPPPDWVDDRSMLTVATAMAGLGLLRATHCNPNKIIDIVPLDIVVNSIIISAWHSTRMRIEGCKLPVYNCTSRSQNPLFWKDYSDYVNKYWRRFPPKMISLYPHMHHSVYYINVWISSITILFAHIFYLLVGIKTNLWKIHNKMMRDLNIVSWVTLHDFIYKTENQELLSSCLSGKEKAVFNTDVKRVNWDKYFEIYIKGIRRHFLKDGDDSIPQAKGTMKKLWWMAKGCQVGAAAIITSMLGYVLLFMFKGII